MDQQQRRDFHKMATSVEKLADEYRKMNTYLAAINQNLVIIGALMAEAGKNEAEQEQETSDDPSQD